MTETGRGRKSGVALENAYQFLLWLIPAVEKFPRSQKFLLGDRMQTLALDMHEALIEATYSKGRSAHLLACNLRLEKLRFPSPEPPRSRTRRVRKEVSTGRHDECSTPSPSCRVM